MNIEIADEELALLEDVVREYIAELRMEIADTDDFNFRQGLKRKLETLNAILTKLEMPNVASVN
jgi:hypothetical protein